MARRSTKQSKIGISRRLLKWMSILIVVVLTVMTVRIVSLNWVNPSSTAFMDAERDRLAELTPPRSITHIWVPYNRISTAAKRAVVAAEDAAFTQHDGVDWRAVESAIKDNLNRGKVARGGSTISMQLTKNLYLSASKSFFRKGAELVLTGIMELTLEKRRILEIYLNVAEWGVGVFGIEAAARHYFGVSAADLSESQAAWLASILPAPKRADRKRDAPWIAQKAEVIQARMQQVVVPR
ncbi:monofunctional biosynthetic peptidoglycan transglycosylase [Betaproteobacteria bacterium LSUCC0115]|nr:monofunctional biosynthetic peptidoglycan transglycosylase [Burkholderiales bacterium LSUCC0115]